MSLLLCEKMRVNESIAIVGSEIFSEYTGYGKTFKWMSKRHDTTTVNTANNV